MDAGLGGSIDAGAGAIDAATPYDADQPASLAKLERLVVIYMENHSFDNL